jgi:hypothetical protein
LAASHSDIVARQLKGFYYRSIKRLLSVKQKVKVDDLFLLTLGVPYEDFNLAQQRLSLSDVKSSTMNTDSSLVNSAMTTLKTWTLVPKNALLKFKLQSLFRRSDQVKGTKINLKCYCGFKINDEHLKMCASFRQFADQQLHPWDVASIERVTSGNVL